MPTSFMNKYTPYLPLNKYIARARDIFCAKCPNQDNIVEYIKWYFILILAHCVQWASSKYTVQYESEVSLNPTVNDDD